MSSRSTGRAFAVSLFSCLLPLAYAPVVLAQDPAPPKAAVPVYRMPKLPAKVFKVGGKLDEEAWATVPAIEHFTVAVLENGQQDPAFQLWRNRIPIDVEEIRERGRFAMLEHVAPPGVGRWIKPHVIGDKVEYEAHPVPAELRRQSVEVQV